MNDQVAFERTIRRLEADNFRLATIGLLAVTAMLAGWAWWMFSARVSVRTGNASPAVLALRAAGVRNP